MSNRCLQVCQRCRPKSCQNSNCLKTSESSRSLRIDVAPALLWTSFLLELQTAQTMEYPEEFDENDRILRDTILQPLLSCQEQEEKVLIQRTVLFYLVELDRRLNGSPSYRFDQLRKNVIN